MPDKPGWPDSAIESWAERHRETPTNSPATPVEIESLPPTTKVVLKAPGPYEVNVEAGADLGTVTRRALALMHALTGQQPDEKTGPIL